MFLKKEERKKGLKEEREESRKGKKGIAVV